MVPAFVLAALLSGLPLDTDPVASSQTPALESDGRLQLFDQSTESLWLQLHDTRQTLIRAQSPGRPAYEELPQTQSGVQSPLAFPPVFDSNPPGFQPQWPGPNGGGPVPGGGHFGANGPQPFRFGWQGRFDAGYLPGSGIQGPITDELSIFEFNGELRYTAPLPTQWIISVAPQFNLRLLDGPSFVGPAVPPPPPAGLPGSLYRVGVDFQLTSPTVGPATFEFGFTPAMATDFQDSYDSDVWQFDGRGAVFLRPSQQWLVVLGAQYWDRLHDKIIPWVGVVFTPDDRWEVRLLYPKSEVNVFLGTPWGVPQWLYVAAEYHIESYAYETTVATQDKVEIEDYRAVVGLRSEANGVASFLEGGWVFGRHVSFSRQAGASPDFDMSSGFIARAGLKF